MSFVNFLFGQKKAEAAQLKNIMDNIQEGALNKELMSHIVEDVKNGNVQLKNVLKERMTTLGLDGVESLGESKKYLKSIFGREIVLTESDYNKFVYETQYVNIKSLFCFGFVDKTKFQEYYNHASKLHDDEVMCGLVHAVVNKNVNLGDFSLEELCDILNGVYGQSEQIFEPLHNTITQEMTLRDIFNVVDKIDRIPKDFSNAHLAKILSQPQNMELLSEMYVTMLNILSADDTQMVLKEKYVKVIKALNVALHALTNDNVDVFKNNNLRQFYENEGVLVSNVKAAIAYGWHNLPIHLSGEDKANWGELIQNAGSSDFRSFNVDMEQKKAELLKATNASPSLL